MAKETQDYAPLQRRATNSQTNSNNFKTVYFPCHFKVKRERDKLALINRRWEKETEKNAND